MEPNGLLPLLVRQDYITQEDADAALAHAKGGGDALELLMQEGKLDMATLGLAIAESHGTTYTDLDARQPVASDLAKLPEDIARKFRVVYVSERDGRVKVATDAPNAEGLHEALAGAFPKQELNITYSFPDAIDDVLVHYEKQLSTRFAEIVKHDRRVAPELFDEIIKDAMTYRASDVHFEPNERAAVIRFRIDGMLRKAGTVSREHYDNVLNRMKILSNLRTDEHYAPQDGAIRFSVGERPVDLRLSVVPTLNGEKAVIRILAEYVEGLSFEALGFSERHAELLERAIRKPFGMILTIGPTGSGKTTTLYSLVRRLNTPEVNITTIEDPVEYRIESANQIQVNPKTDLTFAKGLRAVVRQDPNVILVGEIRDTETAETAVNAALTGHLLLSTFHANDAATAIPRLLDMGVEPFLLASTLELLVAQRLARRICPACRASYEIARADLEREHPQLAGVFTDDTLTLYKGEGCGNCNGSGYKGRVSVVEVIEVTPAVKALVGSRPSSADIRALARKDGARSLFEDGIDKALEGITTVDEVLRVAAVTT